MGWNRTGKSGGLESRVEELDADEDGEKRNKKQHRKDLTKVSIYSHREVDALSP